MCVYSHEYLGASMFNLHVHMNPSNTCFFWVTFGVVISVVVKNGSNSCISHVLSLLIVFLQVFLQQIIRFRCTALNLLICIPNLGNGICQLFLNTVALTKTFTIWGQHFTRDCVRFFLFLIVLFFIYLTLISFKLHPHFFKRISFPIPPTMCCQLTCYSILWQKVVLHESVARPCCNFNVYIFNQIH